MNGLIYKTTDCSKSLQISEWISEIPSVGLNLYSGRLYLITRDGNGWQGSGWPRAPCGLQELTVLFTGVLQSTGFCFGNTVLEICYK